MARAWLRHDGADRQKPEAEAGQRADELAVLVEARRQADRIRQLHAGKPRFQPGIVHIERADCGRDPPRQAYCRKANRPTACDRSGDSLKRSGLARLR